MITAEQYPSDHNLNNLHQTINPVFYSTLSTLSYSSFTFKYEYDINLYGENSAHIAYISPIGENGIGVFNPNLYLKNYVDFEFNPDTIIFDNCENHLVNYSIYCTENGPTTPLTALYQKCIGTRASRINFDYTKYVMENAPDLGSPFSEFSGVEKATLNDRGVKRTLAGQIIYDGTLTSKVYQIKLIKNNSPNLYYLSEAVNTTYTATTITPGLDPLFSNLDDLSNWVIDVPTGPWNINQMNFDLHNTLTDPAGVITGQTNILSEDDTYTIEILDNTTGITSIKMYYEVISECNHDYYQLCWENDLGGQEFYSIQGKKYNNNVVEKSTYQKNRYSVVNNQMITNNYDNADTIYDSKYTEYYTLTTGFITKETVKNLSTLWASKNVYLRIGDEWYGIIIENNDISLLDDKIMLRGYEIIVRLTNKKYR